MKIVRTLAFVCGYLLGTLKKLRRYLISPAKVASQLLLGPTGPETRICHSIYPLSVSISRSCGKWRKNAHWQNLWVIYLLNMSIFRSHVKWPEGYLKDETKWSLVASLQLSSTRVKPILDSWNDKVMEHLWCGFLRCGFILPVERNTLDKTRPKKVRCLGPELFLDGLQRMGGLSIFQNMYPQYPPISWPQELEGRLPPLMATSRLGEKLPS